MAPVVLFPDAASLVIDALLADLASLGQSGVVVTDRVPATRPARLVTVVRTGGPEANLVADQPQVTVECWAAQPEQAHDLAQACWAIIRGLAGRTLDGHAVAHVGTVGGVANLPDPLTSSPRYTFTCSLIVRGSAP